MPHPLLAHQGGWDELLMVALPIAVIALLLKLADRRAKRNLDTAGDAAGAPPDERGEGVAPRPAEDAERARPGSADPRPG